MNLNCCQTDLLSESKPEVVEPLRLARLRRLIITLRMTRMRTLDFPTPPLLLWVIATLTHLSSGSALEEIIFVVYQKEAKYWDGHRDWQALDAVLTDGRFRLERLEFHAAGIENEQEFEAFEETMNGVFLPTCLPLTFQVYFTTLPRRGHLIWPKEKDANRLT